MTQGLDVYTSLKHFGLTLQWYCGDHHSRPSLPQQTATIVTKQSRTAHLRHLLQQAGEMHPMRASTSGIFQSYAVITV